MANVTRVTKRRARDKLRVQSNLLSRRLKHFLKNGSYAPRVGMAWASSIVQSDTKPHGLGAGLSTNTSPLFR